MSTLIYTKDGLALEVDTIAFEGPQSGPYRGYTVRASYLKEPHAGDALVEIFKDGQPLRQFMFPAYKIWNIAAHIYDIVDGEIEKSARGYAVAASDGLGGYAPMVPVHVQSAPAIPGIEKGKP